MEHAGDDLQEFESWLVSWGARPSTVREKLTVIRAGFRVWPDPVTRTDLEAWLANPAFSPWTRATYFSHAKSYFGWAAETDRIAADPMAGMRRPKCPKGRPRPLSPAEVTLVLATADGHLRTWVMLGLFAGLRVHEIAKLRGEDVDQDGLYVVGKGGKASMLPTHPLLWERAQVYPRAGYWFPSKRSATGHMSPTSITSSMSRFFDQLGIEGSTHRNRHAFGTNLLRGGANLRVVQTLLRHESLTTTALYTAVDEDERAAAIGTLGYIRPVSA